MQPRRLCAASKTFIANAVVCLCALGSVVFATVSIIDTVMPVPDLGDDGTGLARLIVLSVVLAAPVSVIVGLWEARSEWREGAGQDVIDRGARRSNSLIEQHMGEPIPSDRDSGAWVHTRGAAWSRRAQRRLEAVELWSQLAPFGVAVLGFALVKPEAGWEAGLATAFTAAAAAKISGMIVGHRLLDLLSSPRMPLTGDVRTRAPLGALPEAVLEALSETEREVLLRGPDVGDTRTLALALNELIEQGQLSLSWGPHPPALRRRHVTAAPLRPPLRAVLSIFDALSRAERQPADEIPLSAVAYRLFECYHCYGFFKRRETYVFARLAVLPSLEAAGLYRREPVAVLGVRGAAQWRRTFDGDQVAQAAWHRSTSSLTFTRPERRDWPSPQQTSLLAVIHPVLQAVWTDMYRTTGE